MPRGVYTRTPEYRAKMSVAKQGHVVSEETRIKLSAANAGQQTQVIHGHTIFGKSSTYISWQCMGSRCNNPKAAGYAYYGGRGIKVCERWHQFENFLADMGERPEGMTLDRVDSNGNYGPGNCRWATYSDQSRNQRRYYGG